MWTSSRSSTTPAGTWPATPAAQLSRILQARVRRQDMLARLRATNSGVLMEYCSLQDAMRLANSAVRRGQRFSLPGGDKADSMWASIGVVSITAASESSDSVLSAADSACYAAKDAGRNRAHLYTENDIELSRRQGEMCWVARINQALEENRSTRFSADRAHPGSGPMAITTNCCCAWRMKSGNWCCQVISCRPRGALSIWPSSWIAGW
ncbi:MAG: diguanylate cyclase [Candidatus Competibacteraceae bacterium]